MLNYSLTKGKMKNFWLLLIALVAATQVFSQQQGSAAPKAEIIGAGAPSINFKRGVEFITPDSLWGLNIRFRMQNRAMYNSLSATDFGVSDFEARVRRLRLRLEGFMYSPKLSYLVQLSFSRGDMDWNVRDNSAINNSPNVVRDACVFYRPDSHWTFIFGQTKLPGNRQRVVSSGDLQFIDRSVVNAVFNIDRDFGFQAHYLNNFGNFFYIVKGAVSSGDGRNVELTDPGLAYTGRIELLPFGEFKNRGDYFEGDLEREETPKLSLAGGLSHNAQARRTGGQIGRDLFEQRDMTTYIFDALFKYRGFALYLEHMDRRVDNPLTMDNQGQIRHITTGTGSMAQASYLFRNNYEVAARFAVITPTAAVINFANQQEHITAGVTKYLIRHRLKLQANVSYITNAAPLRTTNSWNAGFQIELGI
jgi:phosphate-selective porin OprO and OprP